MNKYSVEALLWSRNDEEVNHRVILEANGNDEHKESVEASLRNTDSTILDN